MVQQPKLLQAVVKEAVNPANFAPGEIRLVPKINPQTGMKENHWYGQEFFVKHWPMNRPGRRVEYFITSRGRYDARKGKDVA